MLTWYLASGAPQILECFQASKLDQKYTQESWPQMKHRVQDRKIL